MKAYIIELEKLILQIRNDQKKDLTLNASPIKIADYINEKELAIRAIQNCIETIDQIN